LYDPVTGTFSATGDLPESRVDTATLLPNGTVLVTAAILYGQGVHCYLYDRAMRTFTRIPDISDPGLGGEPTATLLPSGKVLFTGGDLGDFGGSASADIVDPAVNGSMTVSPMDVTMLVATATLLPEGRVLVAGGDDIARCQKDPNHCLLPPDTPPGTAELFDPVTDSFVVSSRSQSEQRHAATLLPNGTVMLSGGEAFGLRTLSTAQIYHPAAPLASPLLYSVGANRQGAILHASTHPLVSPDDPAVVGEALEIYGTGLIDGAVIPPTLVQDNS